MFMYDSQRTPLTSQYLTHFDRLFREANAQGSQKYAMVHNGTDWYAQETIFQDCKVMPALSHSVHYSIPISDPLCEPNAQGTLFHQSCHCALTFLL